MKTILPIKDPPITHAPGDTYMLAMLMTIPEAYPWIMNNFINIYMMENTWEDMFMNWEHRFECPFMEISRMDGFMLRTILGKEKSFSETVVHLLQNGYYVYSCINMKYIPSYFCEKDLSHNIFIYGCDTEKKIFYVADFFNIKNRKFAFQTCTFEELEDSFQHYYDTIGDEDNSSIYDDIVTYTPRIITQWTFDPAILKKQLQAYVDGEKLFAGTSIKNQYSYVFGLKIYDRLLQLLEEKVTFGVRPFQLLYDRARLMDMRIAYLQENGVLSQSTTLLKQMNQEYLDHALLTRNCFLKEDYKHSLFSTGFSGTVEHLNKLKQEDYEFTVRLLQSL